jgi:hypothetical protein
LESTCSAAFGVDIRVLNTGCASPYYSYKFAASLAKNLASDQSDYILILEDDIVLSETSVSCVKTALERMDDHNWYTVDTSSDVLKKSVLIPKFGYILTSANHISYSGAILIKADILRDFTSEYIAKITDLEFPNFDVNLSSYLLKELGHLHLRPGHFLQRAGVKSSICTSTPGRKVYDSDELFMYEGPEV